MISVIKKFINQITKNRYFAFTFISLSAVIFWYLNFRLWHIYWLNFLFFIFYFLFNSLWLGKILSRLISLEKEFHFIFGLFFLLFLIAFGLAVPIVFYKINPVYLFILLLFLTIIISVINRSKYFQEDDTLTLETTVQDDSFGFLNFSRQRRVSLWLIFSIFYFFALALLFRARTGGFILSPWSVIHPFYLYLFFGLVFLTGLFIFSRQKTLTILFIIILISLLLRAYSPIVYQTGAGGDKWRHIAAEKWLSQGEIYSPSLFGESIKYHKIGPLRLPEVFLVGNKNSYANLWGMAIGLHWLTGIDFFWIDLLLGYLLISIFLPLLLFKIGQFFSKHKKFLLLFSFLPVLFFPFQFYSAITVPVSFGFLLFLFGLIILLNYFGQKEKNIYLNIFLFLCLILLYFNYLLYLVFFLEIFILIWLVKKIQFASFFSKRVFCLSRQRRVSLWLIFFVFLLISLSIFPFLDTFSHYSWWKSWSDIKQDFLKALIDFPQRLLTSAAIFPRHAFVEQDNWLYAQTDEFLNRSIFLKILPWHLVLTPFIWLLVIFGLVKYKKTEGPRFGWIFLIFLVIIFGNQFISTYFMEGNHLFSKRLVVITAFLICLPLAWGIYHWLISRRFAWQAKIITVILFLSLLLTTVYASGPKMQVVTKDELTAAEYLWSEIQKDGQGKNYCVVANTWPLLALEAVSGREIVTGGFPVYYEYAQPERVQLFQNTTKAPSAKYLEKALEITEANKCYFMTEKRWLPIYTQEETLDQIKKLLGQPKQIGEVYIWEYQR